MKVSDFAIQELVKFVNSDDIESRRRSGPELVKFFNSFGLRDVYARPGGLPNGVSRKEYTAQALAQVNGKADFRKLVESLLIGLDLQCASETATAINQIITHDDYNLIEGTPGIYKISGAESPEPITAKAHFSNIRAEIIQKLEVSRYTIWVAVAWFTDNELGNVLAKKHAEGVNVQVIVNDDNTTKFHGIALQKIGCEFYKLSPDSPWGKKIMHNKFCVCDIKTVVHGSYNWTGNAEKYNNEGVTITDGRELAEQFSNEFVRLKNNARLVV